MLKLKLQTAAMAIVFILIQTQFSNAASTFNIADIKIGSSFAEVNSIIENKYGFTLERSLGPRVYSDVSKYFWNDKIGLSVYSCMHRTSSQTMSEVAALTFFEDKLVQVYRHVPVREGEVKFLLDELNKIYGGKIGAIRPDDKEAKVVAVSSDEALSIGKNGMYKYYRIFYRGLGSDYEVWLQTEPSGPAKIIYSIKDWENILASILQSHESKKQEAGKSRIGNMGL